MKFLDQIRKLAASKPEAKTTNLDLVYSRMELEEATRKLIVETTDFLKQLDEKAELRFRTLAESGLLDSPPDEVFDSLTELGAKALKTPNCVIDLIDKNRMYMVSTYGFDKLKPEERPDYMDTQSWPLEASFCKNVVDREATLVVENAPTDPIVKDNLASKNGSAIAYIGAPIYMPNGSAIGVMCVSDHVPRNWSRDDVEMVEKFTNFAQQLVQLKSGLNNAI